MPCWSPRLLGRFILQRALARTSPRERTGCRAWSVQCDRASTLCAPRACSSRPRKLAILFLWLPFSVPVTYWRRYLAQQEAELIFAQHVRSAGGEMRELVLQVQPQLRGTGCSMPDLNDLWCAVEKAPSINKST